MLLHQQNSLSDLAVSLEIIFSNASLYCRSTKKSQIDQNCTRITEPFGGHQEQLKNRGTT